MTQDKPLCYAPFIGMYTTGYGEYAPCCVATKHTLDMTAAEYWNSEQLGAIRTQLTQHKWPADCSYCERKAQRGLKTEADIWKRHYERTPVTEPHLLYLDYRPSNTCNLKCRMCVPNSSSLINSEALEYADQYRGFRKHRTLNVTDFDEFKKFLSECELQEIKVLGGEPTMDPLAIEALEAVQCKRLRITTNATNLNRRFRNILERFEHVHIVFSLDATGDVYDYIRTNASWPKVSKRIRTMFDEHLADIYGFNVVCQPYNIFNLPQLEEWFSNIPHEFDVNWDDSDVDYTSLACVLPEHIEWALERVSDPVLISILQSTVFDPQLHDKFKKYNRMLDDIRSTNLIELDKRFEQYI